MSKAFKRESGKTEKRQNERKMAEFVCMCMYLTAYKQGACVSVCV